MQSMGNANTAVQSTGEAAAVDGKPTVKLMVKEAMAALGGSTTNVAMQKWIQAHYPGTKESTVRCQATALTVNHDSRVYYLSDKRPRVANDPEVDCFFRPERGRIERHDPDKHG